MYEAEFQFGFNDQKLVNNEKQMLHKGSRKKVFFMAVPLRGGGKSHTIKFRLPLSSGGGGG